MMTPTDSLAPADLCNVLYCSHASRLMTDAELENILSASRRNNPVKGITGLLVYGGGMFLQWLEGPREAVQALMHTIDADPRHEGMIRLQVLNGLHERLYPQWAMQSVPTSEIRAILIDCHSRARTPRHAKAIALIVELLDTEQLAALKA